MTQIPTDPETAPAEPLRGVARYTAIGSALVALAVAFGLPVSEDQRVAIIGAIAVVGPLIVAEVGRRKAFSPATVAKLLRR